MNFVDLNKKLNAIDSGKQLDECGCGGSPDMGHQPQQDSVNMNITVSGQGAGGIRDILDVLRNMDKPKDDPAHGTMVVGGDSEFSSPSIEDMMVIKHGDEQEIAPDELSQHNIDEPEFDVDDDGGDEHADETFGNSIAGGLGPTTLAISAITATGDDLASKGRAAPPKVNGGENPMAESLINNLHRLYREIKNR
jgi:hypothetical protein